MNGGSTLWQEKDGLGTDKLSLLDGQRRAKTAMMSLSVGMEWEYGLKYGLWVGALLLYHLPVVRLSMRLGACLFLASWGSDRSSVLAYELYVQLY